MLCLFDVLGFVTFVLFLDKGIIQLTKPSSNKKNLQLNKKLIELASLFCLFVKRE